MPDIHSYSGDVNHLYPFLIQEILRSEEVPSRNGSTKEQHPVLIELIEPRKRLITSYGRPVNVTFALAEVLWILGGRNDVEMLSFYNSNIHNYSDNGKTFNAPYGHRLRKGHGMDQIAAMVDLLRGDPASRQAVLQVWDPVLDGPHRTTKDRACNTQAYLLIRDGALDWTQMVRSNDAVWGVPYNLMQWTHLMEFMALHIGVPMGRYYQLSNSMHIYDYHYEEAANIRPFDIYEHLGEHIPISPFDIARAMQVEQMIRKYAGARNDLVLKHTPWVASTLSLFQAHAFYQHHMDGAALGWLVGDNTDDIYGAAQARFYVDKRWKRMGNIIKQMRHYWSGALLEWILEPCSAAS